MREERNQTKSLDSDAAEDDFVNDAEAVMEYFGDVEVGTFTTGLFHKWLI